MPYFLVGIRGNADRGAGLLAKAGIQSVSSHAYWVGPEGSAEDAPVQGLTARLRAEDAARAIARVRGALEGEPFTVEDSPREEPPEGG
jgi:hypothetical protein